MFDKVNMLEDPHLEYGWPELTILDSRFECQYEIWHTKQGAIWWCQWRMLVDHQVHVFDLGAGEWYKGDNFQNGDCYVSEWQEQTAGEMLDDLQDFMLEHILGTLPDPNDF